MRGFVTSMVCMLGLVGVAMQFERPTAGAVAVTPVSAPAAPTYTEPAKPAPAPVVDEVEYELVKVCDGNRCHFERRPVARALAKVAGTTRSNCDCGCGCANCNCGMQPVMSTQQGDTVRRGLFGRRSGGRGLFGGRLFGGRLFGGRMGGGCSSCGQ